MSVFVIVLDCVFLVVDLVEVGIRLWPEISIHL